MKKLFFNFFHAPTEEAVNNLSTGRELAFNRAIGDKDGSPDGRRNNRSIRKIGNQFCF